MISSPCSPAAAGAKTPSADVRSPPESKWKSGSHQRVYGRRLLDALRAARSGGNPPPVSALTIKNAADSALALTAQGKTRWSRALLLGRFRRRKVLLKGRNTIRRRRPPRPPPKFAAMEESEQIPALNGKSVIDRLRVLSRLVPGCRQISTPNLLEEAADYVAALELQVKTMRALADALSSAALTGDTASALPGGGDAER